MNRVSEPYSRTNLSPAESALDLEALSIVIKSSALTDLPRSSAFRLAKPLLIEIDMRLTSTETPLLNAAATTVSSDLWSSRALILTSPAALIVLLSTCAVTSLSNVPLVTATAAPNAAKKALEIFRATDATPPSAFIFEVFKALTSTAPTSSVELFILALTVFVT